MSEEHTLPTGRERARAWLALALLAPVPSLAVVMAMVVAPGPLGHAVFVAAKVWILALPVIWRLAVDQRRPRWRWPTRREAGEGVGSGLVMAGAVVAAFALVAADRLDPGQLRAAVASFGCATPLRYLAAAASWTLVNSLIEEVVYRWFVLGQATRVLPRTAAVVLSALVFTANHVIAVKVYLPWWLTQGAATSVLVAGLVWAWLALRHRSLWSPWLSHVAADVAVFAVGWQLLY